MSHLPSPHQPPPPPAFRTADGAIVLAILATWVAFMAYATGGQRALFFDTFRDTAYVENILAGRVLQDPCIVSQPFWYAPGNPLLMAGVTASTGQSAIDVYASSRYWLNGLNYVLLYLLVRGVWGRATGIVAVLMLWLGSFWWLMCGGAPMPSIQGVALNLLGLMCWHRCFTGGSRWPILTGVVLAASIWHHPLCGVVLAGAIFLHALGRAALSSRNREDRFGLVRRMLVVAAVSGVLAGPLIFHLLWLEKQNLNPFLHAAHELFDLKFALHAHAPLVPVFGLAGAVWIVRRMPQAGWIVTYLLVGLAGQLIRYVGYFTGWSIPYLIPHEFQWHGQLALAVCAAVGVVELARWSDRRATHPGRLWLPFGRCAVFICLFTLGPALRWLPHTGEYFLYLDEPLKRNRDWLDWIRRDTPLDATFVCDMETAHFFVCGTTGRKAIAVPVGHLNPAVDVTARTTDLEALLTTRDEATFHVLAERYEADYLLVIDDVDAPADYASWSSLHLAYAAQNDGTMIYRIGTEQE